MRRFLGRWIIEDALSGKPAKLGSVGCVVSGLYPVVIRSGTNACEVEFVEGERYGDTDVKEFPNLRLRLDLLMLDLKLEENFKSTCDSRMWCV